MTTPIPVLQETNLKEKDLEQRIEDALLARWTPMKRCMRWMPPCCWIF